MSVSSHQTFVANHVSVFKIPPGEVSLARWNTDKDNIVWKGSLRFYEQEVTDSDSGSPSVFEGLRLKLELFNHEKMTLLLEDFTEVDNKVPWAEIWFNPFQECDMNYTIANNGEDTITVTPQSARYYKIITQLPGTGYHPIAADPDSKGCILQIALGLKFEDNFTAILFAEALATYKRRFRNYKDQLLYEQHFLQLQKKIMHGLRIPEEELREPTPMSDFEDDDFGNYVGSYD